MTREIIDLINNNKDLPIYALVDYEVVGGDYGSWYGKITGAKIREFAKVESYGYDDRTTVFKDDTEEYYEYIVNKEEYKDLSDNEAIKIADNIINNLDYKKAIFIDVGLPTDM